MDLRKLILIASLFFLTLSQTFANSKNLFSKAKSHFKDENYSQSLKTLKRGFNINSTKAPTGALKLAAWNFEKLGKLSQASKIYSVLIKKRFPTLNKKVFAHYRKNKSAEDMPEITKELSSYYSKKLAITTSFLTKGESKINDRTFNKYYYQTRMLFQICEEADFHMDQCESEFEKVEKLRIDRKNRIYKLSFYGSFAYVSWKDKLKLNFPNGSSTTLQSNTEGQCLGGGLKYQNTSHLFKLAGCLALATSSVGTDNSQVNYLQNNVPVKAAFLSTGYYFKPNGSSSAFGISPVIVFKSVTYTNPPAAGYTVEEEGTFSYGATLDAMWSWKSIDLMMKIGEIADFESSIISLQLNYNWGQ